MQKTPCEIIIVNNSSAPLENDYHAFSNLTIFNNDCNNGFARACNFGAKMAKGDYLFFLNPDTELMFSNIDDFLATFDLPKVGIIAPKLIDANKKTQSWSAGYSISLWDTLKNNFGVVHSKKAWQSNDTSEVDWVSGAAFVISKKLFDSCNGFDEKFFMYFEDIDLCKRVQQKKQKIFRSPRFTVMHLSGQSYRDNKKTQKENYYASQDYYFKKHFGFTTMFFLKLLRTISSAFSLQK
jgi:GT2 family glycosyltransferase